MRDGGSHLPFDLKKKKYSEYLDWRSNDFGKMGEGSQ